MLSDFGSDENLVQFEGDLPTVGFDPACPSANGCYEIDLVQPDNSVTRQWNLVGNPFPYPVSWADILIVVDSGTLAGTYIPFAAESAGIGNATIHMYQNGSSYAPYNDQTPAMLGILKPGQSPTGDRGP